MSETAPEPRPAAGKPGQGKGFSKKLAGVPVWVWAVGGAAALGAFYLWRKNKAAATSSAATTGYTPSAVDFSGQIATIQSEIQSFQQGESGEGKSTGDKDGGDKDHKPPAVTWTPHISDGKHTLAQIAQQYGTSPAEMFSWMREAPATLDDVRDFANWFNTPDKKLKGLTYYTPASSSVGRGVRPADAATAAADNTGSGGTTSGGSVSNDGGGGGGGTLPLPSGQVTAHAPAKPRPRPRPDHDRRRR